MTSTFESFYAGTAPRLLRYAYGLTGDMAEAQDFTQEAYTRAWLRWKRLQRYDNPESWLRLVVSRLAVDRLRWLGVRRAKTSMAPREAAVVPPPDEEMLTLVAALKRVPMPQRKVLVLHYFLDMPVAEIAAETGTNVNTVKTWLARGRVNVAAQLTDVPAVAQDIQGIRDKARRRRNRTVATTITAFLATATAAAAAFFAIPDATPPTLRPDLVLPYAGRPRTAMAMVVDQRAVAMWHDTDSKAYVGAVDLSTGSQPWAPIFLGEFDDSLFPLGSHEGVMLIMGMNDSANADDFTLFGVDVKSGRIAWQRPPQRDGGPLVPWPSIEAPGGAIIVITDETSVSGIDRRTGRQVWTRPSTTDTKYVASDENRFAQIPAPGVLRLFDIETGRVISERSGLPAIESGGVMLLDDWLYLADSDSVRRIPVTGTEPASRLADGRNLYPQRCGKHICAIGNGFVAAFDRRTGKQLWRKETLTPGIRGASEAGTILMLAGAGDHQVILDPDGRDITPSVLGPRTAYWIDSENLMIEKEIEHAVILSGPVDQAPSRSVELSVYSLRTHEERPLGQQSLYGNCTGIPGRYVCPSRDGFVLFH